MPTEGPRDRGSQPDVRDAAKSLAEVMCLIVILSRQVSGLLRLWFRERVRVCANGSGYRQWSRETKDMDTNIEEECKRRREVVITVWQCRVFNRRLSDLFFYLK